LISSWWLPGFPFFTLPPFENAKLIQRLLVLLLFAMSINCIVVCEWNEMLGVCSINKNAFFGGNSELIIIFSSTIRRICRAIVLTLSSASASLSRFGWSLRATYLKTTIATALKLGTLVYHHNPSMYSKNHNSNFHFDQIMVLFRLRISG
jgi:hypothetical protein